MRKWLGWVVLGGCALAAIVIMERGVDAQRPSVEGAGYVGKVREPFEFQSLKGQRRREFATRQVLKVPRSYGELVDVHGGTSSVLWFKSSNGTLRNVVVANLDLVLVQRE